MKRNSDRVMLCVLAAMVVLALSALTFNRNVIRDAVDSEKQSAQSQADWEQMLGEEAVPDEEEEPYFDDDGQREISCWGDSMIEGDGADIAFIETPDGVKDISYYTAPYTLQEMTGIRTYNFGVGGAASDEISIRAGGLVLYTDRDVYINNKKATRVALVDGSGNRINMSDYYGYGGEDNDMPDAFYINGYLCTIKPIWNSDEVKLKLYKEPGTKGRQYAFIPRDSEVTPKAAADHSQDIMILEMGSNGGWQSDYDILIMQYLSIIQEHNCSKYIIVGDTDDPGTSLGDINQDFVNDDGSYIGTGETMWETALHDAFGDHFINMRVYMLENGLEDCGFTMTEQDREDYERGIISSQLRSDWTHFNSYGYYAKGKGLYLKGVELGYWE